MTEGKLPPPTVGGADTPLIAASAVGIRYEASTRATPSEVSFEVRAGEVVLMLGPSGCGKSTFALALNGLIPHSVSADFTGELTVGGQNTRDVTVATLSEHVTMVFQDPDAQIVTGTLLDEVAFGPENLRLPVAEVLTRSESALRRVGLWERRFDNPDVLSGGARQRLAIACALALASPVIVLDEPTANLDPVGTDEVYRVLAELMATGEHAIVLIEHNLDAAVELVDRVVVLDRAGRVVADGPCRETLTTRAKELNTLGVWLPTATLAALRLGEAGVRFEELPLTLEELRRALDARNTLPEPVRGGAAPAVAPAVAPLIRVQDLSVTKRGTRILSNINLNINPGEFWAIVGTNGAGKTTLLQALAGVVRPPRGTVFVQGQDVSRLDVRTLASTIGFVFQNPEHQFITSSVAAELEHGPRLRGVPEAQISARRDDMLTRFGLDELAAAHPFLLSGGQKRRLSVGTALIDGAPVIALDEPTFGQDRERAGELLQLLRTLNETGSTVIVVTHDLQLVADYCSHVAVLHDGVLAASGPRSTIVSGDTLEKAGLATVPLARVMRQLQNHPSWNTVSRIDELPGGAPA